jgi:nitroimidazol reductase NimA-like FMN-containing flavoprotein (pyridoxamine 5'-phosphate oxidase superfamily)
MSEKEVAELLDEQRKLQLGTINPDGTPHLVTMFYGMVDLSDEGGEDGGGAPSRVAFWTYRRSQKIRNIERDPRVTCLIEAGEEYFELRGALIYGTAKVLTDQNDVRYVGADVVRRMMDIEESALDQFVAATAAKRYAVIVEPARVASWDHRKLT